MFLKIILLLLFSARYIQSHEVNYQYYPRYHLAPQHGWMNDPNGFSVFRGEYHLFYQYNPDTSQEPGVAHWGHAKSKDLFSWEHLPIALYPKRNYDIDGVFSGSAIVENDTMYLIYTGNINHNGQSPDHEQHQNLAYGTDGVNFNRSSYNPIIVGDDRQPNFRDPKIWKHDNTFYAVIGNEKNNNGRVLLYSSEDLITWKEVAVLATSDGHLGFMWECPDFFELDGKYILLFSPQGMEPQGDKYKNLYQTGYIVGNFDYNTLKFTAITEFEELDHGHDFYATQTLETHNGKRILMAWMDMWEQVYPERDDGWTGHMTLPRQLKLSSENILLQIPVRETSTLRDAVVYRGPTRYKKTIRFDDNAVEIGIQAPADADLVIKIATDNNSSHVILSYEYSEGLVSLDRGGDDGLRTTEWKPSGELKLRIFVDSSSIELFCGEGEVTFSSRFFPQGTLSIYLENVNDSTELQIYSLQQTVPNLSAT